MNYVAEIFFRSNNIPCFTYYATNATVKGLNLTKKCLGAVSFEKKLDAL